MNKKLIFVLVIFLVGLIWTGKLLKGFMMLRQSFLVRPISSSPQVEDNEIKIYPQDNGHAFPLKKDGKEGNLIHKEIERIKDQIDKARDQKRLWLPKFLLQAQAVNSWDLQTKLVPGVYNLPASRMEEVDKNILEVDTITDTVFFTGQALLPKDTKMTAVAGPYHHLGIVTGLIIVQSNFPVVVNQAAKTYHLVVEKSLPHLKTYFLRYLGVNPKEIIKIISQLEKTPHIESSRIDILFNKAEVQAKP